MNEIKKFLLVLLLILGIILSIAAMLMLAYGIFFLVYHLTNISQSIILNTFVKPTFYLNPISVIANNIMWLLLFGGWLIIISLTMQFLYEKTSGSKNNATMQMDGVDHE